VTAVVLGLIELVGKPHIAKYILFSAAVDGELGQMVVDSDTSIDQCVDPWQHACGHYAASVREPRSKVLDIEQMVQGEVMQLARFTASNGWGWQQLMRECMAEAN
jgi:hypothetical protein